jgi:pimeloyl-ACP methyl ester carboxylesterase
MARSFCSQIYKLFRGKKQWKRGPSDEGYYFNDKAVDAARYLIRAKAEGADRLFLAGYSRGAAIVLEAAGRLALQGLQVDGLFLFDPVVRLPTRGAVDSKAIPANVRFSRTASRVLDPAIVNKYEGALAQKPYNLLSLATKQEAMVLERIPIVNKVPWRGNPIRPEFGTFLVSPCGMGDHQTRKFTGSHGALGGVGWKNVAEDDDCQHKVAHWMNAAFHSLSLDVRIVAPPLTSTFES